jgi:hypothetical protein
MKILTESRRSGGRHSRPAPTLRSTIASTEPASSHIAAQIDGLELRGSDSRTYGLAVTDLKPVRPRTGWRYIAVAVKDENGKPSSGPLMMGIVSGGGRGVMPWFECRLYPMVEMADGAMFNARGAGLEAGIINLIGTLVPPGGHLMIEYESPGQNETHAGLLLRVPPAASHLGSLMFRAGFRGDFKDWYISEGGHEGPRKLQANKSPNPAESRAALARHRRELTALLRRALPDSAGDRAIVMRAKARARAILREIRG